MQDLNDKVTGNTLTATEWNQVPSEMQNVIEDTGQSLSSSDLDQLGKGIAQYSANGDFYTDSGSADIYVLTVVGGKQAPVAYKDGMRARFIADNVGTGAATVDIDGLGVKNIKVLSGANPAAGDIPATGITEIVYDIGTGTFIIETIVFASQSMVDTGVDDVHGVTSLKLQTKLEGDSITDFGNTGQISHLFSGNSLSSFNAGAVIGGSWESVGPTGSGADNIWTTLDILPTTAIAVKLGIRNQISGSTSTVNYQTIVHGRKTGSTLALSEQSRISATELINTSGSSESNQNITFPEVSIDSSQRFDLQVIVSGSGGSGIAILTLRKIIEEV